MAIYGGVVPMSSSANWSGEIKWYYTQNSGEGTTTIEAIVTTKKTTSVASSIDSSTFSGTLSISGRAKEFTSTKVDTTSAQERVRLTATIKHSGSGKLLDCTIECVINAVSADGTIVLKGSRNVAPTIPRINMSSDFEELIDVDFGQNIDIAWNANASYYYIVKITFEGQSRTSTVQKPSSSGIYRFTGIQIPLEWANSLPNSVYGVVSLVVTAYTNAACTSQKGAPLVGAFTVSVPYSAVPRITACAAKMDNSAGNIPDGWNVALPGHTKVFITASGEGVYGSSIRNFKVSGAVVATIPSAGSLSYDTGIIRTSGVKTFIVTCTDTRGRVSSEVVASPSVEFLDYTRPNIIKFLMSRVKDSSGNVKPAVSAQWTSHHLDNKNGTTAILYYKKADALNWTTFTGSFTVTNEMNNDGLTKTYTIDKTMLDIEFTDMNSYNFKLVVIDTLTQQDERDGFLSTASVLLDFMYGGDGLGIGKICENPGMEVAMDATFFGGIKLRNQSGSIVNLADYVDDFFDPLRTITITLSANGWSASAPYTQRVSVPGMTADRNYGPPYITGLSSEESIEAAKEALSCIDGGSTETDYVVIRCYSSAPSTDVTISMDGVIK